MKVYQKLALAASCEESLMKAEYDYLPEGGKYKEGTCVDVNKSTKDSLVIYAVCLYKENPIEVTVTVTPDFIMDIKLNVEITKGFQYLERKEEVLVKTNVWYDFYEALTAKAVCL